MYWRCSFVVVASLLAHFGRIILKTWGTTEQKLAAWSTVKRWEVYLFLQSDRSEALWDTVSSIYFRPFSRALSETPQVGWVVRWKREWIEESMAMPTREARRADSLQTSFWHAGHLSHHVESLHPPRTASTLSTSVAWIWICIFTNALVSEWEMASD